MRGLNEECGVFGIWGHPEASNVTYFGLHSLQHRGQEGAGIVVTDRKILNGHRDLGLVSEVFKNKEKLERYAVIFEEYKKERKRDVHNIIMTFIFLGLLSAIFICMAPYK